MLAMASGLAFTGVLPEAPPGVQSPPRRKRRSQHGSAPLPFEQPRPSLSLGGDVPSDSADSEKPRKRSVASALSGLSLPFLKRGGNNATNPASPAAFRPADDGIHVSDAEWGACSRDSARVWVAAELPDGVRSALPGVGSPSSSTVAVCTHAHRRRRLPQAMTHTRAYLCVDPTLCAVHASVSQAAADTRSMQLRRRRSSDMSPSGVGGPQRGGAGMILSRRSSGSSSGGDSQDGSRRWQQLKAEALDSISAAHAALSTPVRGTTGAQGNRPASHESPGLDAGIIPTGTIAMARRAAVQDSTRGLDKSSMQVPRLTAALARGATSETEEDRAERRQSTVAPLPGGRFTALVDFAVKDRNLASFRTDNGAPAPATKATKAMQSFKLAAQRVVAQRRFKREAAGTCVRACRLMCPATCTLTVPPPRATPPCCQLHERSSCRSTLRNARPFPRYSASTAAGG